MDYLLHMEEMCPIVIIGMDFGAIDWKEGGGQGWCVCVCVGYTYSPCLSDCILLN